MEGTPSRHPAGTNPVQEWEGLDLDRNPWTLDFGSAYSSHRLLCCRSLRSCRRSCQMSSSTSHWLLSFRECEPIPEGEKKERVFFVFSVKFNGIR